jgi:class 3 adenylate cyclase
VDLAHRPAQREGPAARPLLRRAGARRPRTGNRHALPLRLQSPGRSARARGPGEPPDVRAHGAAHRAGRHEAAILFADLQASGRLSRRLPSAAYFELIRALTTAIDAVVVEHDGIVGKHAGDGVSAFFLDDDLGSSSATARAALRSARGITAVTRRVAAGNDLEEDDVRLNVGVHWGGTLYMGQVTTGGRLEVTALGDEVNECARIQQAARDGMVLASKPLVERLAPEDAVAVGVDPDVATYRALAELPGADEKVVRDAGVLPVTLVEAPA